MNYNKHLSGLKTLINSNVSQPASSNSKPLWHGVVLVAGGAVGAGMFALPMVSAGAWSLWSIVGLAVVWWFTYLAASVLLDTNLAVLGDSAHAPQARKSQSTTVVQGPPLSFDSLVRSVLGANWARVNNLSLAFIMMILMYAYISAGASIIRLNLTQFGVSEMNLHGRWLSLVFAIVVASLVWLGTALVARISGFLMAIMALSFLVVLFSLLPQVQIQSLLIEQIDFAPLLATALPVFVTAFACAGLVPSLVRHYQVDNTQALRLKVKRSLLFGTFLALLVYLFWLAVTFGVIGRDGFRPILLAGGNTADLVSALLSSLANIGHNESVLSATSQRITWFSHCAIITSFLSVALGLFHFIQDKLRFDNHLWARAKAIVVCFSPPTLASFIYPKGFIHAIGYAGLFVCFSFFVVPVMMGLQRRANAFAEPLVGLYTLGSIIVFGLAIATLKIFSIADLLPTL